MAASRFEIEKSIMGELGDLLPSQFSVCSTTALPGGEIKAGRNGSTSAAAAAATSGDDKEGPVAFPAITAKEDLLLAMDAIQRSVLKPKGRSGRVAGGGGGSKDVAEWNRV